MGRIAGACRVERTERIGLREWDVRSGLREVARLSDEWRGKSRFLRPEGLSYRVGIIIHRRFGTPWRGLLGLRLWLDGRSYASRAKGLTPEGVSYSFLGGTVWDGRVLRRGNGLSEGAARCGPKQLVGVAGEIHVVGDEWRK